MEKNYLEPLLKKYSEINSEYSLLANKDAVDFNIFNLINEIYGIGETRHSKFIAFLLNPKADHGKGTLFLDLFLKIILGMDVEPNLDWKVYPEKYNVDILLTCKSIDSTIIIENKSNWAEDQSNQLYRYWYKNIYSKRRNIDEPLGKYDRIIYLAPNENKIFDLNSLEKDYDNCYDCSLESLEPTHITCVYFNKEFKYWLQECSRKEISIRLKNYIEDYINYWEETNFKNETIMEGLQEYFKEKEQEFIEANKLAVNLPLLKNRWVENFNEKLKQIKVGFEFYSRLDKEQYYTSLPYNDFRWYIESTENVSFVYEFNKGLTIWKGNFSENKNSKSEILEELFGKDFIPVNDDSNYAMVLKSEYNDLIKFDENEDAKVAWNIEMHPEKYLDILKSILQKYSDNEEVKKLFTESF